MWPILCIWEEIGLMGHVGHMVHMISMGHVGHVALLVHMVWVGGTCVRYADETCGIFVADVACGTYGTHVLYLQMVHISMNLPNEYKHVFTNGSKNKISSTPNV